MRSRLVMALREFTDRSGRSWRVWDVTAATIHPATRGEDYMHDYLDGWLVFESVDGDAKCRLAPIPEEWAFATAEHMEAWMRAATPVRSDRTANRLPSSAAAAIVVAAAAAVTTRRAGAAINDDAVHSARTFRFPNGRYWTVANRANSSGATGERVLRFTSGQRSLDLFAWPREWHDYAGEELAALLKRSFPRAEPGANVTAFRRRGSDD